jgi:inosine-uridine nucleoside N-ribohydrolase
MAHTLADSGEANILAIVHDTGVERGIGAVSVINHYYGRDSIPLGAYRGPIGALGPGSAKPAWTHSGEGAYLTELLNLSSPVQEASQVQEATRVYRDALMAAADHSVVVVGIGFTTNILSLLQSLDDGAAPAGRILVESKVKELVLMGGRQEYYQAQYPPEWNFAACGTGCGDYDAVPAITHATLELWPPSVPITYIGFEAGEQVRTGLGVLQRNAPAGSPCRRAYEV